MNELFGPDTKMMRMDPQTPKINITRERITRNDTYLGSNLNRSRRLWDFCPR